MARGRKTRITVINDDPAFLELMNVLLEEDSGYEVTTFEAVDIPSLEPVRRSRPDLLIVDLVMPAGETGWRFLEGARRDDELRSIPVIVCSADVASLRRRADELAAIPRLRVLPKPFDIDQLLSLVEEQLRTPA
ncbi:MAG TPA: response regulator [Candidatus Limnocylindria bacterium]|nr:response regulator [Candidatus Limnocylindria bacterium]